MNYDFELTNKIMQKLGEIGVDISYHKVSNNNIIIRCPFAHISGHSKGYDSNPSFGFKVVERKGFVYNCFTCKRHGNSFIKLYEELKKYGIVNVKLNPYDIQNEIIISTLSKKRREEKEPTKEVYSLIGTPDYSNIKFIEYNLKRGINVNTLKDLRLRYVEQTNDIIIPAYDFYGHYKGYIKHNPSNLKKKYINKFYDKDFLFMENKILLKGKKGIVVEGVYDAIKIYQFLSELNLRYEYSVVSLLGSSPTKMQLDLLIDYFSSLLLMGDNDEAGIKMEKTVYNILKYKIPNIWRIKYEKSDPAELTKEEFEKYLHKIRPFGAYF